MRAYLRSETIPIAVLETGRSLIRAFLAGAEILLSDPPLKNDDHDACLVEIEIGPEAMGLAAHGRWRLLSGDVPGLEEEVVITSQEGRSIVGGLMIGRQSPQNLLFKHCLYRLLEAVTKQTLPWGILTGIRPTKLVHKMTDLGIDEEEQRQILAQRYLVHQNKIDLLMDIVKVQKPFLIEIKQNPQRIALYVSIPFCPSRCSYCSFPGFALSSNGEELEVYLQAMYAEIAAVGEMMTDYGLEADSIYLGGGTPTILNAAQMDQLFAQVENHVPRVSSPEITVEGGRPETFTVEKLKVMQAHGVNRLSINPQTMNQHTLDRVGRTHTVEDIYRCFELARSLDNWVINMDLIIGLPGEGIDDVKTTLDHITELRPDNLTVHVLAIKRKSRVRAENYRHTSATIVEEMQNLAAEQARNLGYLPYYLYRQKDMAGNLENVGFALPGRICRYNIAMMEEQQMVVGIGAGASSKIFNHQEGWFRNLFHSVDWRVYVTRWPEVHRKRIHLLQGTATCGLSDRTLEC